MAAVRVGVLRGGPSSEYEVSLKTGASVLANLPADHLGHDILIDRQGQWHHRGLPARPRDLVNRLDVIFNALHGEYGEDGRVQNILDQAGIPYTGSGVFASAVGMKKPLAKEIFRRYDLKTPLGLVVESDGGSESARKIFNKISPPWIVKPADLGSSVGLTLAWNFPQLVAALALCRRYSPKALVEEFIKGREATVGVLEGFRNQDYYVLPVIEINRPGEKAVWDYTDKYSGETEEICPGRFSAEEKSALETMALTAHRALGLRDYSRSDFIISPRGIYILETNTLPGLTANSLMPKAVAAVGCAYPDFLGHLIGLALNRR